MRILSGYHFRDMHQVILSREKEANTTSRTARAVCIQNSGMFCVWFSFENQICQGSSFWQSLDISGDWISNRFDDYQNVMVNLKMNIALMVREKQTKQVKHWALSVYTIGPCFVLNFALGEIFFAAKKRVQCGSGLLSTQKGLKYMDGFTMYEWGCHWMVVDLCVSFLCRITVNCHATEGMSTVRNLSHSSSAIWVRTLIAALIFPCVHPLCAHGFF